MDPKKKLTEQRDALKAKMDALVSAADTENRAMSEEETQSFDTLEKEIRAIDATLERMNTARGIKEAAPAPTPASNSADPTVEERAAADEKQFADYVMAKRRSQRGVHRWDHSADV